MRQINYVIILLLTFMLLGTGCNKKSPDKETDYEVTIDENLIILKEIEYLSTRVSNLENRTAILKELIDEQVSILSDEFDKAAHIILPIYQMNIDTSEIRTQYFVMLQRNVSLQEKLSMLAAKLSIYSCDSLPIEILRIENLNGHRIAVINLVDTDSVLEAAYKKTWAGNYLQGSSGGSATTAMLVNTFLQKEYTEEWIDGVQFLYNNEMTNKFDHVDGFFGKVYYREEN